MSEDFDSNFDLNGSETPTPPASSNRTFIIAVSVLGGLFLLALILIAAFVAFVLPRQRALRETQIASINSANTATVVALTAQAQMSMTPTFTVAPPTATPTQRPSSTAVVAQATSTQVVQGDVSQARTATVSALLTQAAQAKQTATVMPTATALPQTGFAEDVGLPGLLGMTVVLVAVIFMVRRLRSTPA